MIVYYYKSSGLESLMSSSLLISHTRITKNACYPNHQSPPPTSFPPPPPPFLIAAVPIDEPPLFFSAPASPNESQKSCRSGAALDLVAFDPPPLPSPVFSTKLLNFSAAPFVPVWIPFAA